MAKSKSALRGHFLAPWTSDDAQPSESDWVELAHNITGAEQENDEDTEDEAYMDGDGTKETTVTGVSLGYKHEGYFDPADKAQKMIADMQGKIGDDRKVWYKVVEPDGKSQKIAPASVSDIVAGGGEASEFEAFEATIKWAKTPTESSIG